MESLDFDDSSDRIQSIDNVSQGTYEWIFENDRVPFVEWLRKGSGVFWIQGKPGSGKSTLMKHIYLSNETQKIFCEGSDPQTSFIAAFFFHNRGSNRQKTLEGLLQSLLREILRKYPRAYELLLPVWLEVHPRSRGEWTPRMLHRALHGVLSQNRFSLRLLFLIDALDEFEGHADEVAYFVSSLHEKLAGTSSATEVKICCTSRPWKAYKDHFARYPGFAIQEQTLDDLRMFVRDKLNPQTAPSMFSTTERYSQLDSEGFQSLILNKAEGVFLWVKLIVNEILKAVIEGKDEESLKELIETTPVDLEELYTETLRHIPEESRIDVYIMLEIVARSKRALSMDEFVATFLCATSLDANRR